MSSVSNQEVEISTKEVLPVKAEVKPEVGPDGEVKAEIPESPSKAGKDNLKQAMMLLGSGKRDYLVRDFDSAVTTLGECCQLMSEIFGENAFECGEPLFYYGKALLELARAEAGVIENGLDGVPDESDCENSQVEDPEKCTEEEKEEVKKEVEIALEENFTELEKLQEKAKKEASTNGVANGEASTNGVTNGDLKPATNGVTNGDAKPATNGTKEGEEDKKTPDESSEKNSTEDDEEEGGDDEEAEGEDKDEEMENGDEPVVKEDTESIGSNEAGPSSAKETTDKSAIEQEEEEDPSNLQLAWENLDLARSIFVKQLESLADDAPIRAELETKLCDTYMTLGEVSIESETYSQAIDDLTTCLKRRQKILPEDSRVIAETHYQLGVALGYNKQYEAAVESLNSAIAVLQLRIDNLKAEKESKDPSKANDAFYTREREIAEIEGLIPEIHEKIADTKDMEVEDAKSIQEKRAQEEAISVEITNGKGEPKQNGDASKSVSNIGHLVKKRKKSDEGVEAETNGSDSAKKPHIDSEAPKVETNGH